MKFSLVLATVGRTREVRDFLESLLKQNKIILELIIVDQNDDDRLLEIVAAYSGRIEMRHLRSSVRESSHARNLGIADALGDIVAFPDDDCVYPPGVLEKVTRRFEAQPRLTLLSGPAISPAGERGSGRWTEEDGAVTIDNVWTSVIEFNLFIKRESLISVGGFDESLGVGARFGSAEATDLSIRVMRSGGETFYDTTLNVIHPDKRLTSEAVRRAFRYGTGLGRVLRKHPPSTMKAASFFIRPLGGVALNFVRFRTLASRYYLDTFFGRVSGYLARTPEQRKAPTWAINVKRGR
ncbi:glycosyltransferase family 2 protein [Lichenihabitans psoromatis]|uniref:glycosyltransferase family 2 protein n=1 Tax=Lichenihabitans psoromatis TaxID=2528642 RepID=UPI001038377B|nr:glycosyltransferase [Lichenihabitans psoromatis]